MDNTKQLITEIKGLRKDVHRLQKETADLTDEIRALTGIVKDLMNQNTKDVQISSDPVLDVFIDPKDLSTRTYRQLARANIATVRDLTYLSRNDIPKIHNIGKVSIDEIENYLAKRSIVLANQNGSEPSYATGQTVMLRLDVPYMNMAAGTIMQILNIRSNKYLFAFKTYLCMDDKGNK